MTWMAKDTKTDAQKRQHLLFQQLGTLHRTKINLENFARPAAIRLVPITPLQQRVLDAAAYVIWDVIVNTRAEMQKLPSKKNAKKAAEIK